MTKPDRSEAPAMLTKPRMPDVVPAIAPRGSRANATQATGVVTNARWASCRSERVAGSRTAGVWQRCVCPAQAGLMMAKKAASVVAVGHDTLIRMRFVGLPP